MTIFIHRKYTVGSNNPVYTINLHVTLTLGGAYVVGEASPL